MKGLVKYTAENDLQTLLRLSDFIESIYRSLASTRYQLICERYAHLSKRILMTGLTIYGFFTAVPVVLPLFLYATGNFSTDLRIQFPGIDQNSMWGRAFLLVIGNVCNIFYSLSVLSLDIYIIMLVVNMNLVSQIIVEHINDLERDLKRSNRMSYANENRAVHAKRHLLRIVQMTQKYSE